MKRLLILMTLTSCSPHGVTNNPAPPVKMPQKYSVVSEGAMPEKWWTSFGDAGLDRTVTKVFAKNLDLRAAWARYQQAKTVINPAKYGILPEISSNFQVQRQRQRFDFGPPTGEIFPEITVWGASVGADYEIDIWKRLANQLPQRRLEAEAMRNAVSSMAISLAAETTETWLDLVALKARQNLLLEQKKINERYLTIVELRLERGLEGVSALDVYQQRQQLIATAAQVTQLETQEVQLRGKLAVLLGIAPSQLKLEVPKTLPSPPPTPGVGVPLDLLKRRPDVRAAMQLVESADYEVAVAVANMWPRLDLKATLGTQSDTLGGLFGSALWSVLGGITMPIFQRGILKAQADRQKWVVQERLADFGKKLLVAITEVEGSLTAIQVQDRYLAQAQQRTEILGRMVEASRLRYEQGNIDYLAVLNALQSQQIAELELLAAQRQRLSQYIQLCRALGGVWPAQLKAPKKMELRSMEDNNE